MQSTKVGMKKDEKEMLAKILAIRKATHNRKVVVELREKNRSRRIWYLGDLAATADALPTLRHWSKRYMQIHLPQGISNSFENEQMAYVNI